MFSTYAGRFLIFEFSCFSKFFENPRKSSDNDPQTPRKPSQINPQKIDVLNCCLFLVYITHRLYVALYTRAILLTKAKSPQANTDLSLIMQVIVVVAVVAVVAVGAVGAAAQLWQSSQKPKLSLSLLVPFKVHCYHGRWAPQLMFRNMSQGQGQGQGQDLCQKKVQRRGAPLHLYTYYGPGPGRGPDPDPGPYSDVLEH